MRSTTPALDSRETERRFSCLMKSPHTKTKRLLAHLIDLFYAELVLGEPQPLQRSSPSARGRRRVP
jgi:hypothetical protein